MPLLKREPHCHPDDIIDVSAAQEKKWWLVRTMSQQEKALMRFLRAKDIGYYAPQLHQRYRSPNGRLRESFVLLYPGYVFLYGDRNDCFTADRSRHACDFQEITNSLAFRESLKLLNALLDGSTLCQTCNGDADHELPQHHLRQAAEVKGTPECPMFVVNLELCQLLPSVRLRVTRPDRA